MKRRVAYACVAAAAAGAMASPGCSAAEERGEGGSAADEAATGAAGHGANGPHDQVPASCSDSDDCAALDGPCLKGLCVDARCTATPANDLGDCDDTLFCTIADHCWNGLCVGSSPRMCASNDACHIGVCDEDRDACANVPGNDGGQCDDEDPCTGAGLCAEGSCEPGPPLDCSYLDAPCAEGSCEPGVGCVANPRPDGISCDPGMGECSAGRCEAGECVSEPIQEGAPCDVGPLVECGAGLCKGGACVSVPLEDGAPCDDGHSSPCSQGVCAGGRCLSLPQNEGAPCDDFLFCTIDTICVHGTCGGGQPNPCVPDDSGCWVGTCDELTSTCTAVPANDGVPCDDGLACTASTACAAGLCVGGASANDGAPCDDGRTCTQGDTCSAGRCGGSPAGTIFFSEDFSDNAAGWTLGAEWEIGPAQQSYNGAFGADPALDHTYSHDNGVAGVAIGGNALSVVHPFSYLESPPFDASGEVGQVFFGFYRWLNSDFAPHMHNRVDVWNGSAWINLWTSGGPPGVEDSPPIGAGWTYVGHDVTPYRNAAMRIRFGFEVTDPDVYTVGSWNVDDVVVASLPCP